MITTILEVLVAVVVLIVIIAFAALHFLRADDSDTFDDMPEEPRKTRRHPVKPHPAGEPRPPERRVRRPEPARDQRATDDRGARQPGYPERRSNPATGPQRPVPVAARQAKAARAADAEPANGWDSLSDVDYWAELSSDKPVPPAEAPAAAASSPARRSRRAIEPKADAPRPAGVPAARADSGQLPVRQRSQSRPGQGPSRPATGPYGAEPATQSLAALARMGDQPPSGQRTGPQVRPGNGQRPAQRPAPGPRPGGASRGGGPRALPPAQPQSPAAQASHSGGHARPPLPMDDDPLTSPSFPAINTSDSRSYRTRSRSSSQPSSSQPSSTGGRGGSSYGEPARQLPGYPEHSTSSPNGYPVQPAATTGGHRPAHSAAPAANPYGSYVSAPQPSYPEPASAHLDAAAYGTGYAAGQQAAAAANWYGSSTDANQAINGHLPAPGNGNAAADAYPPADYGIGYQTPAHQSGQHGYGQPGHPGQYDQRGYQGSGASYGQDGYEAYPGYGGAAR